MGALDWRRTRDLFEIACELSLSEQSQFLIESGAPPTMIELIERMLESERQRSLRTNIVGQAPTLVQTIAQRDRKGDRVGQYEITSHIGSGGMAEVYSAQRADGLYDARVAIKFLSVPSAVAKTGFEQERRLLAQLEHPNIARLMDGGVTDDGTPYLVMEHVQGVPLTTYCDSHSLSRSRRLHLFLDVLDAVEVAHAQLIIHRDLKPDNILVDDSGRCRLLDFGIAQLCDGGTAPPENSMTPRYASPEQRAGERTSVASDVYQLGLVLHKLLTDQLPERSTEVVLSGSLRGDLRAILAKALQLRPSNRYRSVSEFRQDIVNYLDGYPVAATRSSRAHRARLFFRRNRGLCLLSGALVMTLCSAVVVGWMLATSAMEQARRSNLAQELLVTVFEQADPLEEGFQSTTLGEALQSALPGIEARLEDDAELAVTVYRTLGRLFIHLGMISEQERAYRGMLQAAKQNPQQQEPILVAISGIGDALVRTDVAASVAFLTENLPPAPPSVDVAETWAGAKYHQAYGLIRLNRTEAARDEISTLVSAVDEFAIDHPKILAWKHHLQSVEARWDNNQEKAIAHMRENVRIQSMRVAQNDKGARGEYLTALHNLAMQLGIAGRFEESDRIFRQAIAGWEAVSATHPNLAVHLNSHAGLLFRMNRYEEAREQLLQGNRLLAQSTLQYSRYQGHVDLATYSFAAGDMPTTITAIMEAIRLAESVHGRGSPHHLRRVTGLARRAWFSDHRPLAQDLMEYVDEHLTSLDSALVLDVADLRADMGDWEWVADRIKDIDTSDAIEIRLRLAQHVGDDGAVRALLQRAEAHVDDPPYRMRRLAVRSAALSGDVKAAAHAYREGGHALFKAHDRLRLLSDISRLATAAGSDLPDDLQSEFELLQKNQEAGKQALTPDIRDQALTLVANPA